VANYTSVSCSVDQLLVNPISIDNALEAIRIELIKLSDLGNINKCLNVSIQYDKQEKN
jgi:hypothetical protein